MGKPKRPRRSNSKTPSDESHGDIEQEAAVLRAAQPLGRPSELTPELAETIVEILRGHAYRDTAARAVGIDRSTLWRWMKRGEEESEGLYFEFCNAVKRAEALAEADALKGLMYAGEWQALAWILERKFPDRYGKRNRAELPEAAPEAACGTLDAAPATLLASAQRNLARVIARQSALIESGQPMTEAQLSATGDMAKTLALLAKEERELSRFSSAGSMTDADLIRAALENLPAEALGLALSRLPADALKAALSGKE